MAGTDMRALMKRFFELCQPDLRKYYRVPRKGRVVAAYASDGAWYADVQPLRNDESVDSAEPVLPRLELPVIWGGPDRGVVCPPEPGTSCVLAYYDGDPNYPYILAIRWHGNGAPEAELREFVIQLEKGVEIRIDKARRVVTLTPEDIASEAGKAWSVRCQTASIDASVSATVRAPQISLLGDVTSTGMSGGVGSTAERSDRTHEGSYALTGPMTITGDVVITGNLTTTGNSQAGSRSGGVI